MKRYLLVLVGYNGINNSYDTINKCIENAQINKNNSYIIYDTKTDKIIKQLYFDVELNCNIITDI